jgi:hypothetical protein
MVIMEQTYYFGDEEGDDFKGDNQEKILLYNSENLRALNTKAMYAFFGVFGAASLGIYVMSKRLTFKSPMMNFVNKIMGIFGMAGSTIGMAQVISSLYFA